MFLKKMFSRKYERIVIIISLVIVLIFFQVRTSPNVLGYTIEPPFTFSNHVTGFGDNLTVGKHASLFKTYQNYSGSLTILTSGYTTTNSYLNFSNIKAYNVTQVVEDSPNNGYASLDQTLLMSFTVNMSCTLSNISVLVYIKSNENIYVHLYSSLWNSTSGRSEPNRSLIDTSFSLLSDFTGWYNITVNWSLNTSSTDNNTFFIALAESGLTHNSAWYFVDDGPSGDNDDEGVAWSGDLGYLTKDMELKVQLSPFNSSPSPSFVNLIVNDTLVNDTSYGGFWESHVILIGTVYFNITANWTISFDVNVTLSEYREDLTDTLLYVIYSNSTEVQWNITINVTLPQDFIDISSTLVKPPDWTLKNVYVNGFVSTFYQKNGNNVTLNGVGYWNVLLNSTNYLVESLNTITAYNNDSIKLDFAFEYTLSVQNKGNAKITVYNTTGYSIVHFTTTPINNGTNDLVEAYWTPEPSLPSGNYNATALWCNGTEVGYRVRLLTLLHPAYIETSYVDTQHLIGDNITLIINYKRNDTSEGITNATVTGSWIYQSGIIFTDNGNGQYSAEIPTYSDYNNGTYQFTIFATKQGYQNQTYAVNITLIYKTDLVGDTSYSVQYENTITISATYKLSYDATTIPGAVVIFDFQNGTTVEMKDYANNGTYVLVVSSNVTAGTYNFVITATKQGYNANTLSGTLTVYNISTTLTPVNGTTEFSLYYNVESNITFYYNDSSGQGITGATTSYTSSYKNGTLVELGNGYYSLKVTILTVNKINFTITIEKKNYQSQTILITVTVLPRPTEVLISSSNNYSAGDSFNITLVYKDVLTSEYIPNATVDVLSNASSFTVFNLNNGTYKIQGVYNTLTSFNESLFANVSSTDFSTKHLVIQYFIHLKSLVSPAFQYNSTVPFAENETVIINYGVNGNPTIGLNVSLAYALLSYNNGTYKITLSTDKSYPGSYSIELKIQVINYEPFIIRLNFVISEIPAHIEVTGNTENYWSEEITISAYFHDDYNGTYLDNWTISISGISSITYSSIWLGTHYNVTIYTNKLNATIYPITITASKLYYNQSLSKLIITVYNSTFAPDYPSHISQYENETLSFSLTLYDYYSNRPVHDAVVIIRLEGKEYQARNLVDGIYTFNISLVGLVPGSYNASLIITKQNYDGYQADITVEVLKKYDVILKLLPEKFVAGAENTISAKLTYTNSTPISSERIYFSISTRLENESTVVHSIFDDTDEQGIAIVVVYIPDNAKNVSVTAKYAGSVSLKSAQSANSAPAEPAFTVNTVLFGPLSPYFFGTLIAALAAVVAVKQIQARKRKALEEYRLTISYYEDLLKIRHFLIIHKGSGVSMFYKSYGTKPFEPDLISGFITALSQFGTEIVDTTSETIELKQKGLYIFATDTKYMRFVIMSYKELSITFKKILTDTIKTLGEKYDPMVAQWRGDLRASKEIGLALEKKLALEIFYVPVMIKTTQNLKGKELVVVDKIQKFLKKIPNVNLKQIIDMLGYEDLPVIISLVKRQVIGTASKNSTNNKNPTIHESDDTGKT